MTIIESSYKIPLKEPYNSERTIVLKFRRQHEFEVFNFGIYKGALKSVIALYPSVLDNMVSINCRVEDYRSSYKLIGRKTFGYTKPEQIGDENYKARFENLLKSTGSDRFKLPENRLFKFLCVHERCYETTLAFINHDLAGGFRIVLNCDKTIIVTNFELIWDGNKYSDWRGLQEKCFSLE